jgi:protein-S-isoprenylcysteine O-methyltransferase Ste14
MDKETILHIIAVVVIVAGLSISIYHRRKANQQGEEISIAEEGSIILNLRRLFGILGWFSVLIYLINPNWMSWSLLPLPSWLRWLGAALMVVCLPLIYWVFSSLGKNVTPTVVTREEHKLVTHGPYRWVRHPLYTVGFLLFTGLSLLATNWFIFSMLIFGSFVLIERTSKEEQLLEKRFGDDYRDYMAHTGRFLPRFGSAH